MGAASEGRGAWVAPVALSAAWLALGLWPLLGFVPTLACLSLVVVGLGLWRAREVVLAGERRRLGVDVALGVGLGLVGLALTHGIAAVLFPLWPEGRVEMGRLASLVSAELAPAPAFAATALIGAAEEVLWRGLGHHALSRWLRPWPAVVVGALWYAACQAGLGAVLPVAAAVVLGLVTGGLRVVTGGLVAPLAMHLVWTLGVVFVWPP